MGNEIGQFREWDEKRQQDWEMLTYPLHDAFQRYIQALNRLYLSTEALYSREYDSGYFQWIECHAPEKSVYIFQRGIGQGAVIAAFNFSDQTWENYPCRLQQDIQVEELLNSDWTIYGGQTEVTQDKQCSILLMTLPAFSARIFRVL